MRDMTLERSNEIHRRVREEPSLIEAIATRGARCPYLRERACAFGGACDVQGDYHPCRTYRIVASHVPGI